MGAKSSIELYNSCGAIQRQLVKFGYSLSECLFCKTYILSFYLFAWLVRLKLQRCSCVLLVSNLIFCLLALWYLWEEKIKCLQMNEALKNKIRKKEKRNSLKTVNLLKVSRKTSTLWSQKKAFWHSFFLPTCSHYKMNNIY